MPKLNPTNIRKNIANSLRNFGRVLNRVGLVIETGASNPYEIAAKECENNSINHLLNKFLISGLNVKLYWGYNLKGYFHLPISELKHVHPEGVTDLKLMYEVTALGKVENFGRLIDQFEYLSFSISISGKAHLQDGFQNRLIACWHLDRDDGRSSHEVHPLYHINFGGTKMTGPSLGYNFGNTLLLDLPRLPHLPLEGVLATDFILANFFFRKWLALKEVSPVSNQYKKVVIEAQNIFWKPCVHAISAHFGDFDSKQLEWRGYILNPNLIA